MGKTLKKLLSFMMAFIMIITMLPVAAFMTADEVAAADSRSVTATGEIPGETVYTRHTGAITSGHEYLILSADNGNTNILTNNNGIVGNTTATVNSNTISGALSNEANVLWTFTGSGNSYQISNNGYYIPLDGNLSFSNTATDSVTVTANDNGYIINRTNRRLRYNGGWGVSTYRDYTLYLYEKNGTGAGQTVELTLSPFVTDITSQNGTSAITKSVTVGGSAASSYEITWSSSDVDTVTVDAEGTVTGVARGSALITATLTSVSGTVLESPISASVKVNVEYELQAGTPGHNTHEYPAEGAVKMDKTATSNLMDEYGLSQVELDVAGVGLRPGVDVVLIVDVSNSMEWSLQNSGNSTDAARRAEPGQKTKLKIAMEAAETFSRILLEGNSQDGSKYDNTVSFVTFAGYDAQQSLSQDDQNKFDDSVMTVFTAETKFAKTQVSFQGTELDYGVVSGTTQDYRLKVTNNEGVELVGPGVSTHNGRNRGNTNYDYAFYQASSAVTDLQAAYTNKYGNYAESGRDTYIVFMTDGAPSHYNGATIGDSIRDKLPGQNTGYTHGDYNVDSWLNYITNNDNAQAKALYDRVKGKFYSIGFDLAHGGFNTWQWTDVQLSKVLRNMVNGNTDEGAPLIPVQTTDNEDELIEFYRSLATLIKPAGTEAQVIDTVNTKDFTVQMAHSVTGDANGHPKTIDFPAGLPCMEVKTYDLYTAATATAEHPIGSRTGTSELLEKVTFNAVGTEAYSDQFGADFNIMTTSASGVVTINARYFTYTKDPNTLDENGNPTEKFVWNIGDIPDKQIALSFYVYLKGALEGTAPEGAKYTNEKATLSYLDIEGHYVKDEFDQPVAVWKDAVTDIEYYLVNTNGQPVNRVGQVVSFDLRIRIGEIQHREFTLNKTETGAVSNDDTFSAADYLPEGIEAVVLYDPNASYEIRAASGHQLEPFLHISNPPEGLVQTTIDVQQYEHVHSDKPYDDLHITSHIAFALRYDLVPGMSLTKDVAVIDYAKPIDIDVLANDSSNIPAGFTATLMGYMAYADATDMSTKYPVTGDGAITPAGEITPSDGSGKFSLTTSGNVNSAHYALTRFMNTIDKTFGAVKFVNNDNATDQYYMYNEINVIPANNIYYEDDFMAEGNEDAAVGFVYTGTWNADGESSGNVETPGNAVHGGWISEDPGLSTDTGYSDGSAHKTTKSGAKVTFSFTGTGVDVYTRTNASSGQVRAKLYKVVNGTETLKSIQTMDNYSDSGDYYQIPTLSFSSLDYGTYKLELTAGYVKKTDGTKRSTYYIDGIRVYNPIQNLEGDSVVAAAYGEAELGATFTNVRGLLVEGSAAFLDQIYKLYYMNGGSKTYVNDGTEDVIFACGGRFDEENGTFVDNVGDPIVDTEDRTISVSQIQSGSVECTVNESSITLVVPEGDDAIGFEAAGSAVGDYTNTELGKVAPINEVYLAAGQSISIQTDNNAKGYYIGIKKLDGNDAAVLISNGLDEAREITVDHTTDLYYRVIPDADDCITVSNGDESGKIAVTKLRIAGAASSGANTQSLPQIDTELAPKRLAAFLALPVVIDDEGAKEEEVIEQETGVTDLAEEDINIENPESYEAEANIESVVMSNMNNQSSAQAVFSQLLSRLFSGIRNLFRI